MQTRRGIDQQLSEINGLSTLVDVYGQIAAERMMKIRGAVLRNRAFLNAINDIFKDALGIYAKKLSEMLRLGKLKNEGGRVTFLAHNGKTVAVFISANTGFYGDVVQRVFDKFINDIKSDPTLEVSIVGKIGKALFVDAMPDKPYTFFELPDYGVRDVSIETAVKHLVQYEQIRIYYAEYESVVTQAPTQKSIAAGTPIQQKVETPKVSYIFEPSVESILMFFETQIFVSLFEQSLRESQLSKFAARILAMQIAQENIDTRRKKLAVERFRVVHRTSERKQLNALASAVIRV